MGKYVFIKMVEKTMKNKAVLIHQTTSLKVKFTTVIKHYGIVITNYTGGTIITPRIYLELCPYCVLVGFE